MAEVGIPTRSGCNTRVREGDLEPRRELNMSYSEQDRNENVTVKVNAGTYRQTGEPQTDFIISEPGFPGEHTHLVMDINGNEVYREVNPNR